MYEILYYYNNIINNSIYIYIFGIFTHAYICVYIYVRLTCDAYVY